MKNETSITIIYEIASLIGYDPKAAEGMDINASAEKYEEMLTDELHRVYPESKITVEQGDYARTTVTGFDSDDDEEENVNEIDGRIYQDYEWVVKLDADHGAVDYKNNHYVLTEEAYVDNRPMSTGTFSMSARAFNAMTGEKVTVRWIFDEVKGMELDQYNYSDVYAVINEWGEEL